MEFTIAMFKQGQELQGEIVESTKDPEKEPEISQVRELAQQIEQMQMKVQQQFV